MIYSTNWSYKIRDFSYSPEWPQLRRDTLHRIRTTARETRSNKAQRSLKHLDNMLSAYIWILSNFTRIPRCKHKFRHHKGTAWRRIRKLSEVFELTSCFLEEGHIILPKYIRSVRFSNCISFMSMVVRFNTTLDAKSTSNVSCQRRNYLSWRQFVKRCMIICLRVAWLLTPFRAP